MAGATGHKTETYTVAATLADNVAALTATSGVDISNAAGVTAVLAAEATRTITGGALRAYAYLPVSANKNGEAATWAWVPYNDGDVDTLSSTVADRYKPIGDKLPLTGVGRVVYLPDAVTVSAGTTVTLTYTVRRKRS